MQTIITHSLAAIAGATALYLVLRNNPKLATKLAAAANRAKQLVDSIKKSD